MRDLSLALAALLLSVSVAAAQTATAPGLMASINTDAPPPPTREPSHPADGYALKASNPSAATTGQARKDDRFPADRGDTRPFQTRPSNSLLQSALIALFAQLISAQEEYEAGGDNRALQITARSWQH